MMNLETTLPIIKRHLLAKKRQSIIAILGVTFGISMYIVMSGFMTGVNKMLDGVQFIISPHLKIYNEYKTERPSIAEEIFDKNKTLIKVHHQRPKNEEMYVKHAVEILDYLKKDPNVLSVSTQVASPAFFNYGPSKINGALQGVDIEAESQMFDLKQRIKKGNLLELKTTPNSIIMGKGLAKNLGVDYGDIVNVTTPKGISINLKVVGILQLGMAAIDNVRCYANTRTVQTMLQKDDRYITDIYVKLKDFNKAPALATNYQKLFGYKAESWVEASAAFESGSKIRTIMIYVVSVTLLIVAGFGIYNIMSMAINDKMKDIAILKATGYTGNDIVTIFLGQSIIIGLIGALLGLCLGFCICYGLSFVPFNSGGMFTMRDTLPMNFDFIYYIIGILFAFVTTCIAGYLPAKKAAAIDPVKIFRG
ncbi:MAG: FtsX-like permease family protein [Cytophagales bacterium]